jgi:hypothetical protein
MKSFWIVVIAFVEWGGARAKLSIHLSVPNGMHACVDQKRDLAHLIRVSQIRERVVAKCR